MGKVNLVSDFLQSIVVRAFTFRPPIQKQFALRALALPDQEFVRQSPLQAYAVATCGASSIFVAAVWI
jgi:hypothetical protein